MGLESQAEYFIAQTENIEGRRISVYYAPLGDSLAVPKEVLRARSISFLAERGLRSKVDSHLSAEEYDVHTIEPSSIDNVRKILCDLGRTHPIGVFVDESAPEMIRETPEVIEQTMANENRTNLAKYFGFDAIKEPKDNRPYPGQYL